MLILPDEKDGGRPKSVRRIVVDGEVLYDRDKSGFIHYNMLDRLAEDKALSKIITKEFEDGSVRVANAGAWERGWEATKRWFT